MSASGDGSDTQPPRGSLRKRAGEGALFVLGGQGVAQILRLGGNLLLARLLFPEAFGLMAIVHLVLFALEQISNIGIPAAIMRFERGEDPPFLNTAWTIQIVRGLMLWGVAVLLAPTVADFYRAPMIASILPVATFASVIMGLTSTRLIVLTRRLELGRRVAIELTGQTVGLVVMLSIAWQHGSIWALVFGGLANEATICLLSHLWISGPRNRIGWDAEAAQQIFSIGKWVFASSGLSFLLAQMDIALLGRLVDARMLGVYSMGASIANMLRDVLFRVSSSVLAPVVAQSNRESLEVLRARYAEARGVTLPAAVLMGLGAAIAAPSFFGYLYDARYADAGWICQLALIRFWFAYLQVSSCLTLLSMGDGRTWAISNVVGLAGVTTGCLVGFELGALPGFIIGMGIGAAGSFVVPVIRLAQLGVATPLPELSYTAVGAALATLALGSGDLSGELLPQLDPALRTLIFGSLLIAPFGLWAALRLLRVYRPA